MAVVLAAAGSRSARAQDIVLPGDSAAGAASGVAGSGIDAVPKGFQLGGCCSIGGPSLPSIRPIVAGGGLEPAILLPASAMAAPKKDAARGTPVERPVVSGGILLDAAEGVRRLEENETFRAATGQGREGVDAAALNALFEKSGGFAAVDYSGDGEEVHRRVEVLPERAAASDAAVWRAFPGIGADVAAARGALAESVHHGKWSGEKTTLNHSCCGDAAPKLGFLLREMGYPVDVVEAELHYYLMLESGRAQIVIDPTIRQFFGGPRAPPSMPEIFVGTPEELLKLFEDNAAAKTTRFDARRIYFNESRVRNERIAAVRRQAERVGAMRQRPTPPPVVLATARRVVEPDAWLEYRPLILFALSRGTGERMPATPDDSNPPAPRPADHSRGGIVGEAAFDVGAPLPAVVKGLLKTAFLAPARNGKSFLRSLSPARAGTIGGPTLAKIKAAAAALERTGDALSLRARLLGPLTSSKEPAGNVAFLAVFESGGKPAGFFGYVVKTAKDGTREGVLHSAYFDKAGLSVSGIAEAVLAFTGSTLGPALGARRETLKADYAGRYVWARSGGFRFDPDYRYYDIDGKPYKTWDIARRSLSRFLKAHRIRMEDLRLRGKPVPSLDALTTPADFAALVHRQGRTVRVRPLVTQETLGEEAELAVGKAFMMGTYLPRGAPYVLSQGGVRFGNKFAADAMPWWNGYRDLPIE